MRSLIFRFCIIIILLSTMLAGQDWGSVDGTDGEKLDSPLFTYPENSIEMNPTALEGPIDAVTYMVGPGDVFSININHTDIIYLNATIAPAGDLLIPGVGLLNLKGMNLQAALAALNLACEQVYRGANISISLTQLRQFKVLLSGAVKNPGQYTVLGATRLSDILERGELLPLAMDYNIRIEHVDGSTETVDPSEFFTSGSRDSNRFLKAGDHIHVPFGKFETSGLVARGAIENPGYYIIKAEESLEAFIERKIQYKSTLDIYGVKLLRRTEGEFQIIDISPETFGSTFLKPGDNIEFLSESPVSIIGHIGNPGSYIFVPGLTAGDYVSRAGGLLPSGTTVGLKVTRIDGSTYAGEDTIVQRGDIIEVRRSLVDVFFGDISIFQLLSGVATLVLAVSAAGI